MLSTAHFESLCSICSYAKERYIVRLYADLVDVNLPLDELPYYDAVFTLSIDGQKGHAEAAIGRITHQNFIDVDTFLRSKNVLFWRWERHKNGKIKQVIRQIKEV